MSGRVLTAEIAGREGTREKREPVVKVVRWSPWSESGDDGGPTSRRLSKGCATRTKWPSSYRGGAEEALEDEKHILELGVRSTKVRVIWNIIIEKLKTAGAETCPTHGGPGGICSIRSTRITHHTVTSLDASYIPLHSMSLTRRTRPNDLIKREDPLFEENAEDSHANTARKRARQGSGTNMTAPDAGTSSGRVKAEEIGVPVEHW
ncbi:hypothetical protein B0H13DRAFT_1850417 [Mycena leptocephala]|nr:hypothetical protein B0H13DRAFT_1850417 [Mycena leptocephala]